MPTVTVKSGDTLSGIAKTLGLSSYKALTGFKSGNPNLIRPGEVLSYGGPAPVAARAAAPKAAPNPLAAFATKSKADSNALLSRQKAEQEGLFGNFETIRRNQEALPALYNRLQTEAGIPELSQTAQGFKDEIFAVKGKLDRLGEDVLARTTGTLTTEAQRRRLQASEEEPLQSALGRLGTGLEPVADLLRTAGESVNTQFGLNTEQQDRELEPVKLRINSISDRFAREITGFTSNRELELTGILDKLERDRFLSDRDWTLAQQLAAEERAFARQKSLASQQLTGLGGLGDGGNTPPPKATPSYDDWAGLTVTSNPASNFSVSNSSPLFGSRVNPQGGSISPMSGMVGRLQGAGVPNYKLSIPKITGPSVRVTSSSPGRSVVVR